MLVGLSSLFTGNAIQYLIVIDFISKKYNIGLTKWKEQFSYFIEIVILDNSLELR